MPPKKYITKRTIEEFTKPVHMTNAIEDEIVETLANYSIDHDMNTGDLPQYFKDLKIPCVFIVGNKRLDSFKLVIEGTDVIDFDKLMTVSYHLILFRNNEQAILEGWRLILSELKLKGSTTMVDLSKLQEINEVAKVGMSNVLLIDMIALATEGTSLTMTIVDFAYIMGKLHRLEAD